MLGAVQAVLTKPFPKSENPLPLLTARGFSFHALGCFLDIKPQSFFDNRRATKLAPLFLDLVDLREKISRNIRSQRDTTGRKLPCPMGGNILPNLFCIALHA